MSRDDLIRRHPILSQHWPSFPPPAGEPPPALRLVSSQPVQPTAEPLTWAAYSEAVAVNDLHRSVATERCRTAALTAWRHVFLEECGEAKP